MRAIALIGAAPLPGQTIDCPGQILQIRDCPGDSGTVGAYDVYTCTIAYIRGVPRVCVCMHACVDWYGLEMVRTYVDVGPWRREAKYARAHS